MRWLDRRIAAALGLAAAAAAAGCPAPAPTASPGLGEALPPAPGINVLVVSFDALRADRLGVYGYPRPTSPGLDAFARGAVVFDRVWAAGQATPTSFAAAFTGRWPAHVFRGWRLEPVPTLAGTFAAAGYDTAFFSASPQLVPERGFDRGFGRYEILAAPAGDADAEADGDADDEQVLRRASRWLAEEARAPFLLWVHFLSPHAPYDHRAGSAHLYRAPAAGRFERTTGPAFEVRSAAELARVADLYDGEVLHADRLFGRLQQVSAAAAGHAGEILVAVTADHGEELMDHGGLQHVKVFEEVIRIPLIVRHPRGAGGRRSDLPASNVDLLPTLAEIAGLEPPAGIDGVSLLAPPVPDRLRLALAMTHPTEHYLAAARGSEKAIVDCRRGSGTLYDLAADPREERDLLGERRRSYRRLVAAAALALDAEPCRLMRDAIGGVPAASGLDDETAGRLRALGYLGGGTGEAPDPGGGERD